MNIVSAQYANAENTAAAIQTTEAGAVLVSLNDTPELWAQMLEGAVAAYVEPPAPAVSMTPLQFIERFSQSEQLAIVTAAMSAPALRLWYDKLMAAQEVVFDDPRLSGGLDALVGAGLITVERKGELLT